MAEKPQKTTSQTAARDAIRAALALLAEPGQVLELRIPTARRGQAIAGYFDDLDAAVAAAADLDGQHAGIYVTLNPVTPALLARYHNRLEPWAKQTTSDRDILGRRWLLVDCDAVRPSGISSTDAEHEAAIRAAQYVRAELLVRGWPLPVLADSGNGGHLLYRVALPADDGKLCERVLQALAREFDSAQVHIDTACGNAARITKLYGSRVCKGDDTPERPHRRSAILDAPDALEIVSRELLEALAGPVPQATPRTYQTARGNGHIVNLAAWVGDHLPDARGPEPWQSQDGPATRWVFECPWRPEDGDSAYLLQFPSGAVFAGCQHETCPGARSSGNHWGDLRKMIDPEGSPTRRADTPRQNAATPVILLSDRHLPDVTAEAVGAWAAANDPPEVFLRDRQLTRVVRDEKGRPMLEPMSNEAARNALARVARFEVYDAKGHRRARPPSNVLVENILAEAQLPFPGIERIIEAPVIRPDGTLLVRPGLDPATGLYYLPDGLEVPPIPDSPSDAQKSAAIELLHEALYDFPFIDAASLAHAYVGLLTPVLRPYIIGHVPLLVIDKPQAGAGATLLAELIGVVATGRPAAMLSVPEDDASWRKEITSLLLRGASTIVVDNVEGRLWAPSLGALLTAHTWSARLLGQSLMVEMDHRATWICTGNNVQLGGDLPRRAYWSRMDPHRALPWQRTGFKHPHLIEWATVNRGRIVAAILTLARGWIVAGGNVPHDLVTFGSFERWAQCMGGILHYAGVSGFLSNLESMYAEADVDTPEWEGFLSAWADNWGGRAVTGRQVIEFLQEDTLAAKELLAALPGFLGELDKGFTRRLGKALRGIKDRRFPSGLVLKKAGSQDRALRWRVVKEEGGTYRRMDAYGRWVASDTDAGLTDAERYYRDLGDTEEMPF